MRECVWDDGFEAQLRRIEPDPKLADDIMIGVEWVAAREPEWGYNIPNTELWHVVWQDVGTKRHFVILYAFTPEKVFFLSIIQSPEVRI
jgi:hypothetical protein